MEVRVTAGAGPGAAETYLRLMAEAELRRALACPRYQPPRQRVSRSPVQAAAAILVPPASRLMRAVRAGGPGRVLPAQVTQWAAGQAASTVLSTVGQRAASAAEAARPAAESAWSQLAWAMGEIRWRSRRARSVILRRLPGRPRHHGQRALMGVHRVRQAASTLVTAEAISESAAQSVLVQLAEALAARAKIGTDQASGLTPGGWPGGPAPALPAGPVRAVPVGAVVPLGPDGSLGTAQLLTLVLAPDRASLTAVAHLTSTGPPHGRPRPGHPWRPPAYDLNDLTAVDDQGTYYRVAGSSGQARDHAWSMTFDLHPLPVPGARWLDITIAPGAAPIRVDLPASGAGQPQISPAPGIGGPGIGGPRPGAGCPADRPLDGLAEHLLTHAARGGQPSGHPHLLSALPDIAGALQAAGVLAPGSAALGRLAALADRLAAPFPASLRPLAGPADLPAAWLSVLNRLGRTDGLVRDAPVAAVLPEVDGARFALAGLRSAADSATVHALAWGWQPDHRALGGERFSWWARDDAGRWQVAAQGGHSYGGGQVDVELAFVPPLHPSARSVDIFVVGPAGQAAVTVPLDWAATG
jgi:hypothetical protein